MISHLDENIGRVLDAVEANGQANNTIIILAGDNGLAIGKHGLMGKQNLYDHSIRVPLIFCGPTIPQGKQTDAFAYLLDIFPTLCGLIGLDIPETVDGVDLTPMIRGSASERDSLYFAYTHVQRAIRTKTHKLIEYVVNHERHTQLFNLTTDPDETNDLSQNPEQQTLITNLRDELLKWRERTNDTRERECAFWNGFEHTGGR
jgi:arylsulfatase A-like enzyme